MVEGKEVRRLPLESRLELMLISAERYALGRKTYIVADTTEYIACLVNDLSDWCIGVLIQDIEDRKALAERSGDEGWWGDACDKRCWLAFYDTLIGERERRDGA